MMYTTPVQGEAKPTDTVKGKDQMPPSGHTDKVLDIFNEMRHDSRKIFFANEAIKIELYFAAVFLIMYLPISLEFSLGALGIFIYVVVVGIGICLNIRDITRAVDGLETKVHKLEQELKTSKIKSSESKLIQSIDAQSIGT